MILRGMPFSRLLVYPFLPRALDVGEPGQCKFRFLGALAIFIAYLAAAVGRFVPDLTDALSFIGGYLVFSYAWGWVVALELSTAPVRQSVCLVIEQAVLACGIAYCGLSLAPLIWVPVSISMGYGLRFGHRIGIRSAVIGCAMQGATLASSPFWRSVPSVAFGVVLSALVLPVYAIGLNSRLQAARSEAERKTAELTKATQTDSLTGLLNRLGLEAAVGASLESANEGSTASALVYIDLDGFKAVNDTAGHAAGDKVLRDVALAMRAAVRAGDVIARLGGDEFAVVLNGLADAENATRIAGAVLSSIRRVQVAGHPGLALSASLGVHLLVRHLAQTPEEAISCADAAMLFGKRGGKCRVVCPIVVAGPDLLKEAA